MICTQTGELTQYLLSKNALNAKTETLLKCPICKCSLFGAAPYIHDCKIKNLLHYKKSRFLDESVFKFVVEYFDFKSVDEILEKNVVKKIDKLLISGPIVSSSQSLENDNRINVDLDVVIDLYTGNLKDKQAVFFGSLEVDSIFTNDEVIHLAFGVKQEKVSRLARKYLNGKRLENSDWVFLHKTMMNGVDLYGKDYILQLLDLSNINISTSRHIVIFNMLQKLSNEVIHPAIRLEYHGMTYICEFVKQNEKIDNSEIIIKQNQSSSISSEIFRIKKNGSINAKPINGIFPTFQLIQAFCESTRKLIIGYGLKEGRCSICNKPLTDNQSKRKGIGPICERNILGI